LEEEKEELEAFIPTSAYSRNMGRHLLYVLAALEVDVNKVFDGMNVVHKWVAQRGILKGERRMAEGEEYSGDSIALDVVLGSFKNVDLNVRVESGDFKGMTPLHIAVIAKDVNLLEALWHYKGEIFTELETLNYEGETVLELAESMLKNENTQSNIV
jgi:hypothetical protein